MQGRQKDLEVIYIYLEHLTYKALDKGNRKKYLNITKRETLNKLDEWIFDNLIDQAEYRKYLEKYFALKQKLKIKDIDEYILNKHYRPRAIDTLNTSKKKFDLKEWTKPRFKYEYQRKTNLWLKDGRQFSFDFRNVLESPFILKGKDAKIILAVGGCGGSGQREKYTMFTSIYFLLGKKQKIKHHLLKYNSVNKFKYLGTFDKPIITFDLGSNYPLGNELKKEIWENSIELDLAIKKYAVG